MATLDLSALQTEGRNPRTMNIDTMSTLEMCRVINEEDATVALAVQKCLPEIAATIDAIAPRIQKRGRLIYVGAGTSGRLGILDASEIPPTFSAPSHQFLALIAGSDAAIRTAQEGAEDSHTLAISDMDSLTLSPLDTIIGIAASGRTPYVLSCLDFAKQKGCQTVGIACVSPSEIKKRGVDFCVEVVTGPEVVGGSTRLKAGTGTKMVLNMVSTGVMVRIGKTFGNMMVDLKASNKKLKQRSRNIIRGIESTAEEMDDAALDERIDECGGSVKLALMTIMTGPTKQDCEKMLEEAGGVLSIALQTQKLLSNRFQEGSSGITKSDQPGSERKVIACIDAGGSKCAVAIANEAGNVARGEAGPCNVTDIGIEQILKVVTLATQRALEQLYPTSPWTNWAEKSKSQQQNFRFTKVRAGMAGFDRPGIPTIVEAALSNLFSVEIGPNLRVTNDVDLLASAIENNSHAKAGIVLIAGTGSVSMSYRIESGIAIRSGRAGGWGSVLGDGGSGFDIGRMAVQHTLSELESARLKQVNSKSLLRDVLCPLCIRVLSQLDISLDSDVSFDVLSHILTSPTPDLKTRISGLARHVLDCCQGGTDKEACRIVDEAANSLVSRMVRLVEPVNIVPQDSVLVLAGGLMKSPVYTQILEKKLSDLNLVFQSIDIIEDGALTGLESMTKQA